MARALTPVLAGIILGIFAAPAAADPGWTVRAGAALEGGDALYCNGCDVQGVRNVQSPYRLDVAVGNSDPRAGPIVWGTIAFCWDITCRSWAVYGGRHNPLLQCRPSGCYLSAPNGRRLAWFGNRGIVFYVEPKVRPRQ